MEARWLGAAAHGKYLVSTYLDCSLERYLGRVAMQDRSQPVLSFASVIGWETRPVLTLATGREFATRP